MLTQTEVEAYFAQIGAVAVAARGEWRDAKCPWHDDRSRSFAFNVGSGGWVCQAGCGKGGLKEAAEKSGIPFPRGVVAAKPKPAGDVLEKTYDYMLADGTLAYQVLRYKRGTSKTFRQRQPDGSGGWIWKMDGVKPLPYCLPEIAAASFELPVYVVEGEKDVENLIARGMLATTNHGGAGKWRAEHAVFLHNRRVVVIPDNDAPGRKHADQVAASLQGIAAEVKILVLPDLPAKGDVSDWLEAGGTPENLAALAASAPLWTAPAAQPPLIAPAGAQGPSAPPFMALGYSEGMYYYLAQNTQQVTALTAAGHGKLPLLSLAPMNFWAKVYGSDNGQIAWGSAACEMMQACAKRGVFDYSRIRGRGAWHDGGRPVVHVGDSIIMGGARKAPGIFEESNFIYPAAIPMRIDYQNPIDASEAVRLSELCDMLSWEKKINGRLLAGWMALAPICGALAWRPHIWITGAAGTGKSWVMDHIMRPMLGRVGLFVQGDTTEAGIRQALGYDARPVLFDEAEGESERAQVRMQNVMALMRQSSSENGSVIVKGSISGQVKVYSIRSCFAFSSIGVGVKQHSDATRVSVLSMRRPDAATNEQQFAAIRRNAADLLSPEWVGRLHARMITLIPTVRANAETFARAAAAEIGSQRMGDQNGALLAGAYALHSDDIIAYEDARAWVAQQDWSEQTAVQETPDEVLCLQRILQHVMKVNDNGRMSELNVAEVIGQAESHLNMDSNPFRQHLLRMGIRLSGEEVAIANQHRGISEIMSGTPWSDWGRILSRLPGASKASTPVRFASVKVRATIIPRDLISN